jgi:hypothetical protein
MVNHKPPMLGRTKVLRKAKRGEGETTKGLVAEPTPSQSNIMEVISTWLEA